MRLRAFIKAGLLVCGSGLGAGGCVIVSQDRQGNFSRTVWITL
jgi:hypothetical protein